MQSLYEWDFYGQKSGLKSITERNIKDFGPGLEDLDFIWKLIEGIEKHLPEINNIIEKAAPEWPLAQIPIIDRNVLRIGLYELLYADKEEVPPKVAINDFAQHHAVFQHLQKNFLGCESHLFLPK